MSDEHLSGEEKRAKMKEEFKKELRARKEFQDKVKRLRQTKRINEALANMSVEDDTDEWVNKLNEETAFMEARTEVALDSAKTINVPIEGPDGEISEPEQNFAASEAELQKIAAEELVRQMKAEMAGELGESILGESTSPIFAKESAPAVAAEEVQASAETEAETEVESEGDGLEDVDRPFRKMIDDIGE